MKAIKKIEFFSKYELCEDLNENILLNKGKYIIYVYIPKKYNYNKNEKMNYSLKIIYNKSIIFDFIKFDIDYKYLLQSISDIFCLKFSNRKKM